MTVKSLFLRHFRNYEEALFTFCPNINVIVGNNAQGKTNLLEAIYLLIMGRSFRTRHLNELIQFGKEAFYIEALFEKHGIQQVIKFSYDGHKRTILHNSTPLPSLSALLGLINGVILSPEDHLLIKGGPQGRRHFLDLLIAQTHPLYLHHLTRYLRAMKQRLALLKERSFQTIPIWEEQMALAAAHLTLKRAHTMTELEKIGESEILGRDSLTLAYHSQALNACPSGQEDDLYAFFIKQFEKNRLRESELKMTLSGPHRDDFTLLIGQKEARRFASQGQQRSSVASLKLIQWRWLQKMIDQSPIFCIDDLGTSFDALREDELYTKVRQLGQVFITSTREAPLPSHLIRIAGGKMVHL